MNFWKWICLLLLLALVSMVLVTFLAPSATTISMPRENSQVDIREGDTDEKDKEIAALTWQVELLKKSVKALQENGGEQTSTSRKQESVSESRKSGLATPSADEEDIPDNALVQSPATYPGGAATLLRFVSENLRYPAEARQEEVQGIVVLRFVVQKDGTVGKVQVTKSLTPETDREAERVVKSLKKFLPARQDGRPVAVWFTLPIRFQSK